MRRGKNLTDVPECPEYLLRGDLRSLGVSMTDRVTCPACGEANRARARFCDRCGAELQQASEPLPSGKRTVTLLHIDLLRSTSLGERSSPEVRPRAIQAYYEVVDKAILEQGGTIENHLGDGVLAAFGRPEPGVDDALRAVRAAVTVHAAMPELNRQVAEWGVELRVHSAVNTGEVSLAWLLSGEDRGREVTLGDPANVCAKLNDKARDGQILIGEATWHLVRDEVRVHPGDPLTLRLESREAPVRAWRVLGLEPEGSRHASEARMVGRERYLSQLGLYYDQVVHDHCCVLVTILGAAGIGKSRLVDEFLGTVGGEDFFAPSRHSSRPASGTWAACWQPTPLARQIPPCWRCSAATSATG